MTAREYLEKLPNNTLVTFVIAEAHKDKYTPFYHYEYRNTPYCMKHEWLRSPEGLEGYLVVNADHPPIDITGTCVRAYNRGECRCAVIVQLDEMRKMYRSDKQYAEMVEYYQRTVK